ncbi:phosphoribosylformylglycinamidine cyclo-ligase [Desulfonatronum thioautotrophicum]|uniref:phosphoribosylformylglycinamidine cyclo-ligase n=1 Tax=Desulfonatronum thioautotrophicum TaxID=617001 RepID=UPI0005EBDEB5|nr:phosphoribosylformylglycinamidine cyclo-ligase [Desulfonatronum thioautotrophicum]
MMPHRSQAYSRAGVDIQTGNRLVQRIKKAIASTHTKGVISDIGGFGGLFKPDMNQFNEPVLVAATDGVGTKLKLAFAFQRHDTVGIDLVAMNVNDILVQGAKPLFFLDYLATGKLDLEQAEQVVAGIAAGCKEAGCALLGGETAEMPDFYAPGEYDLAGFCVGIVEDSKIIDGSGCCAGDQLIGLASSGFHANGYSLVRQILSASGLQGQDTFPGTQLTVADTLLSPTRIYVKPVLNLLRDLPIKGMVHITGGGFYDNIPRVIPRQLWASIQFGSWPVPQEFLWVKQAGGLSWEEMHQVFNVGIGFLLVVDQRHSEEVISRLRAQNQEAWLIGELHEQKDKQEEQVRILF